MIVNRNKNKDNKGKLKNYASYKNKAAIFDQKKGLNIDFSIKKLG